MDKDRSSRRNHLTTYLPKILVSPNILGYSPPRKRRIITLSLRIVNVEFIPFCKSAIEYGIYICRCPIFQRYERVANLIPLAGLHLDGGVADDVGFDGGKQRGVYLWGWFLGAEALGE